MVLAGNVPIGALTLLGEAAHFSLRGPIIKLKRRSPAGASWTPACFPYCFLKTDHPPALAGRK